MNKKVLRFIILFIIIVIIILLARVIYGKIIKYKFKNILIKNDAINYEMIEKTNNEEIDIKVKDRKLLQQNGNNTTWISEFDGKRIIMDTESKIAIITENDKELKVNSLNYTYINEYFEKSSQKFKYLGKKDGYYLFSFTEKKANIVTFFYLNEKTNLVEKLVKTVNNGAESISTFEIKINSVSNSDVKEPDLTDYHVRDSVSSKIIEN